MFADSENLLIKSEFMYENDIMENNIKSHKRSSPQIEQIKVAKLKIKTEPDYHITASEPYVSFSELSYLTSPATGVLYGQASTTVMTTPSSVTYEYSPGRVSNAIATTVTKEESESTSSAEVINTSIGSYSSFASDEHIESLEEKQAKKLAKNRIAGI
jgi:hypothetical protein